jgi:hypothetical protein
MTSSRKSRVLRVGAGAGVALAGSGMATFLSKEAQAVTSTVRLRPLVDPLPIQHVLSRESSGRLLAWQEHSA